MLMDRFITQWSRLLNDLPRKVQGVLWIFLTFKEFDLIPLPTYLVNNGKVLTSPLYFPKTLVTGQNRTSDIQFYTE